MLKRINLFLIIFMIFFKSSPVVGNYDLLAYDFKFKDLDGSELNLSDYKGKVIVIVNVASQCGFTSQYEDMQKIWEQFESQGVVIIGVPSNDFNQEKGSSEEIKNFCEAKFGISFPMTEKVSVKGPNAHPFYNWAQKNYGKSAIPKWNFHKIIIDKNGKVAKTFSSITNPSSSKFITVLKELI